MHVQKINNKEAQYDKHHPLFGYKPFADYLMFFILNTSNTSTALALRKWCIKNHIFPNATIKQLQK